jgi:AbrB family looped-hinge helix DNA binding protein
MKVVIDRAGRIVVPKPLREELALTPGTMLEIDIDDGDLRLSALHEPPQVIEGPNGPVVKTAGPPVTDADVRRTLEAARDRR